MGQGGPGFGYRPARAPGEDLACVSVTSSAHPCRIYNAPLPISDKGARLELVTASERERGAQSPPKRFHSPCATEEEEEEENNPRSFSDHNSAPASPGSGREQAGERAEGLR